MARGIAEKDSTPEPPAADEQQQDPAQGRARLMAMVRVQRARAEAAARDKGGGEEQQDPAPEEPKSQPIDEAKLQQMTEQQIGDYMWTMKEAGNAAEEKRAERVLLARMGHPP